MLTGDTRIVRVSMERLSGQTLGRWAALYCRIWREPPWNEDHWTSEGVSDDIRREMANSCAEAFLAFARQFPSGYEIMDRCGARATGYREEDLMGVVGFTWGYRVCKEDLRDITGSDELASLFTGDGGDIFYIDELGVASQYRKRGFGRRLSEQLIAVAKDHGCSRITLRTDVEADPARALYASLGFKELDVRDAEHADRSYWLLESA